MKTISLEELEDTERSKEAISEALIKVDLALYLTGCLPVNDESANEALQELTIAYYAVKRADNLMGAQLKKVKGEAA